MNCNTGAPIFGRFCGWARWRVFGAIFASDTNQINEAVKLIRFSPILIENDPRDEIKGRLQSKCFVAVFFEQSLTFQTIVTRLYLDVIQFCLTSAL